LGIGSLELGEKPDNLLGKIADLITTLTGTPPGLETIDAAAAALGEALAPLATVPDSPGLMLAPLAPAPASPGRTGEAGRAHTRLIGVTFRY
jgi:hypothetical protein